MNQIHCATCERDVTTSEVNLVGNKYVDYYGHDVYFMPPTPDVDQKPDAGLVSIPGNPYA